MPASAEGAHDLGNEAKLSEHLRRFATLFVVIACIRCGSPDDKPLVRAPIEAERLPHSATVQPEVASSPSPTSIAAPTATPTQTPTPTATPTQTPTPTPIPDSDGDGLLDPLERSLGTNPFQRDSDVDGLDDGEEMDIGSDPLFPDTDRDGTVDGDDILPLADARVRVHIVDFVDRTSRGLLHETTNAYFVVLVGNNEPVVTPVYRDVQNERIAPVVVNVPDNIGGIEIGVLAFEYAPLRRVLGGPVLSLAITSCAGFPIPIEIDVDDEAYDLARRVGDDLDSMMIRVEIPGIGERRVTEAGSTDRLKAQVTVEVVFGGY